MNETIIKIKILDDGSNDATIIVTGERNRTFMFEEEFAYADKEKPILRLHYLKQRALKYPELCGKLSIVCIRKILNGLSLKSKPAGIPDYRTIEKPAVNQKKCGYKGGSCKDTTCDGTQKKGCLLDQVANIKVSD